MPTPDTLLCEILAPRPQAEALAEIVAVCARDVCLPVKVRTRSYRGAADEEPLVTLHLPVEAAASQHPVWCLACRLACFCPRARVSVLVKSESAFVHPQTRPRHTRSA